MKAFDIDEAVDRITEEILSFISQTDLTSVKDLTESYLTLPVSGDVEITIDYGYNIRDEVITDVWLYFSLDMGNGIDELNIAACDTYDLSENSIRFNLKLLLEDLKNYFVKELYIDE